MDPTFKFVLFLVAFILWLIVAILRRPSIDGLLAALAAAAFTAPFMLDAAKAM